MEDVKIGQSMTSSSAGSGSSVDGVLVVLVCRYGVRPSRHIDPRFARHRNFSASSVSATNVSAFASHFTTNNGVVVDSVRLGIRNQIPCRSEKAVLVPANAKWKPGGRCLTPRKRAVTVKERRSMPANADGGKSSSRRAGVSAASMLCFVVWLLTSPNSSRAFSLRLLLELLTSIHQIPALTRDESTDVRSLSTSFSSRTWSFSFVSTAPGSLAPKLLQAQRDSPSTIPL